MTANNPAPENNHRPEVPPPAPPPAPEQVKAKPDAVAEIVRAANEPPPPPPATFKHSATVDLIFGALADAQAILIQPTKSKIAKVKGRTRGNQDYEYTYRYCDINDVLEATKTSLNAKGIMISQYPEVEEKPFETTGERPATLIGAKVTVRTILGHRSGQWMECSIWAMSESCGPQAIGSVITYLRRYGLQLIAGIAADDDEDGEAGQGGQAGGASTNAAAPRGGNGQANPQPKGGANIGPENEEFTLVATLGNYDTKPASGGRTQWLFYLPGQPKPASTVAKPLADKILKEQDTGMPIRWHLKRAGSFLNLESVEILPAGSLS
jgi:hypothetical protein